jgi:hypothetical protein
MPLPPQEFFIDKVYDGVVDELERLNTDTDEYKALFESVLGSLAAAPLPVLPPISSFSDPAALPASALLNVTKPTGPAIDLVGMNMPADPATLDLAADIAALITSVPEFNPSVLGLNLPNAPAPIDTSGLPLRPDVDGAITLPVAPDLSLPSMGALTPIVIPEFVFPTLPTFTETMPVLTAQAPDTNVAWAEPAYDSEQFNEIWLRVKEMMAGSRGLPPAVEAALFERTRGRDATAASTAVKEAYEAFAGRGYSMPPGMLVKQVNAVIEDSQLKANATNREIYIKSHELLISQLNVAIERGLALEQINFQAFTNVMTRLLDITKFRVESAISVFNAEVQAFNIRTQAYNVAAQVFKILIDAALTKLEEFRARIEAQKAIGQLNQQVVDIYTAQLGAVETKVKAYVATMEGAKVQTEIVKAQIDAYRGDIQAYAARLDADKTRFEAYETQVKGESAKAGILEAEARAYASRVQALDVAGTLSMKKIDAKIEKAKLDTQQFAVKVTAERDRITAQAEQFRALVSKYAADVQSYGTELQNNVATRELDVKRLEASLRNAIARYEVELKKYDGETSRIIELARLNLESLRTMAQYAAQLAAGAMSARNISMGVSGQGQGSDSLNYNYNYNYA